MEEAPASQEATPASQEGWDPGFTLCILGLFILQLTESAEISELKDETARMHNVVR